MYVPLQPSFLQFLSGFHQSFHAWSLKKMVLFFSEPYGVLLSTMEEFQRGQTVRQEEASLGWVGGGEPGSSPCCSLTLLNL